MVTFNFAGTVAAVSNPASGVQTGDSVSGSVAYDSTQFGSGGLYTFDGSAKAHTWNLTVSRSGVQVFADSFLGGDGSYRVRVIYNTSVGGVEGTTLELKGPGLSGHTMIDLVMFDAGNVGMTPLQFLPTQTAIANFATSSVGV